MALSIKNDEADRLARELADVTGQSLTDAIITALRQQLERETGRRHDLGVREEITRIQKRVAQLPRIDERSDEELVGYDEAGLPS